MAANRLTLPRAHGAAPCARRLPQTFIHSLIHSFIYQFTHSFIHIYTYIQSTHLLSSYRMPPRIRNGLASSENTCGQRCPGVGPGLIFREVWLWRWTLLVPNHECRVQSKAQGHPHSFLIPCKTLTCSCLTPAQIRNEWVPIQAAWYRSHAGLHMSALYISMITYTDIYDISGHHMISNHFAL